MVMKNNESIIGQYRITRLITGGHWKENCYVIECTVTKEIVVVDPGDNADIISGFLRKQDGILKCILLTHAHHDHIGAVQALIESFSINCYLRKSDARLLRQAPFYSLRFAGKMILTPKKVEFFEELQPISFGNCLISSILTPGHTPGSVCYSFGDFVFTGDTLLYEHIGRTDLPGGSLTETMQSIENLLETNPNNAVVFPGHGREWNVSEARLWWQKFRCSPPEYNKF